MSNGQRYIWDPAAPNSVSLEYLCEVVPPTRDMFCAGHSATADGDILVHGGNRHVEGGVCAPQPNWSFLYQGHTMCWSAESSLIVPSVPLSSYDTGNDDDNFGYWYPGSSRLPDGRVISVGGGSTPLNPTTCLDTGWVYYIDGWQIHDPTTHTWLGKTTSLWFNGLQPNAGTVPLGPPASVATPAFNYYPLLMTLPTYPVDAAGFVYSPVVTNNRTANNLANPSYVPVASVSARMDLGAGGWPNNTTPWAVTSQIHRPGTTIPRNLYYPSGLPRPIVLDNQGKPTGPTEVMILGGTDNNIAPDALSTTGGRAALAEVSQITGPDLPGAPWSSNGAAFPNLLHPRIYANSVLLPTGEIFVVGGSTHDFFPFSGATPISGSASPRPKPNLAA